MPPIRNLESERACYAYEDCVMKVPENLGEDYLKLVRSIGALIRQSGLMQTLAFCFAKNKDGHIRLVKHLCTWLRQMDHTNEGLHECEDARQVYRALLQQEDWTLMVRTREVQALIIWLKRFAEAKWGKKADKKGENPDNA